LIFNDLFFYYLVLGRKITPARAELAGEITPARAKRAELAGEIIPSRAEIEKTPSRAENNTCKGETCR